MQTKEEIELKVRETRPNHPGYSAPITFRPLKISDSTLLSPIFKREAKSIRNYLGAYQNADKWSFSDANKFVSHMVHAEKFPSMHWLFLIGGHAVGLGSLEPYGSDPRDVQVVLVVFGNHQGKGIGTVISNTLKYLAFEVWGFSNLYWLNDATNVASSKAAQSLGLQLEKSYEDTFIYGERGTGLWYRWKLPRPTNLPPGILQGADIDYWSMAKTESMLETIINSRKQSQISGP